MDIDTPHTKIKCTTRLCFFSCFFFLYILFILSPLSLSLTLHTRKHLNYCSKYSHHTHFKTLFASSCSGAQCLLNIHQFFILQRLDLESFLLLLSTYNTNDNCNNSLFAILYKVD